MTHTPEETNCPTCGEKGLRLDCVLIAKEPGTYSLAGQQMKVSAVARTIWRCDGCGATGDAVAD